MIYGIIDIGANTIRMAVYKIDGENLELLIKKKYPIGLAGYVKDNCMQQEGIDKTCVVLQQFAAFLQTFKITNIAAFTMAALRNVNNTRAAVQEISARTGIKLTVLSGEEEARFDFIGATHALDSHAGILVDIGGASTELVLYRANQIEQIISLPIGSLAMHTQYIAGLLPSQAEVAAISAATLRQITASAEFTATEPLKICGIGGTFKGAMLLYNELFKLPTANNVIPAEHFGQLLERFTGTTALAPHKILDILVKVVPERIKTIIPGMIIADTLAQYLAAPTIVYSNSGVREGYLYDKIIGNYSSLKTPMPINTSPGK